GDGCGREAAMEVVMAVVMTAAATAMVVWQHGDDVVGVVAVVVRCWCGGGIIWGR
nr:hypothetical protein [Tanacetum cinerariifolium]